PPPAASTRRKRTHARKEGMGRRSREPDAGSTGKDIDNFDAPYRRHRPPPHLGSPISPGAVPARVAISENTFGTYIRVSAGSASAIAVNDVAPFAVSVRCTRPSPAL